jgi:predicted AAA+ superfamily ATPase
MYPDQIAFNRFLGAVAARTGQLLNYASLARDVEVDNKKVKSWLSALDTWLFAEILKSYWHTGLAANLFSTATPISARWTC